MFKITGLLLSLGWKRMGDASLIQWVWQVILPSSATMGASVWWLRETQSLPVSVAIAFLVGVSTFVGILAAFGHYRLHSGGVATTPRNAAAIRNFVADAQTIQMLIPLLASVKDDATNYQPHIDNINNRLAELELQKGIFLASAHAEAFNFFMAHTRGLLASKEAVRHGHPAIPLIQQRDMEAEVRRRYDALKAALDHDYAQGSP